MFLLLFHMPVSVLKAGTYRHVCFGAGSTTSLAEKNNRTCFTSDSQTGLAVCWRDCDHMNVLCAPAPVSYRKTDAYRRSTSFLPPQRFRWCLSHSVHLPHVPQHGLKGLGLLHAAIHSLANWNSHSASPVRWAQVCKQWLLLPLPTVSRRGE